MALAHSPTTEWSFLIERPNPRKPLSRAHVALRHRLPPGFAVPRCPVCGGYHPDGLESLLGPGPRA